MPADERTGRREDDHTGRYYDLLAYDRQLDEKELKDYELDFVKEV